MYSVSLSSYSAKPPTCYHWSSELHLLEDPHKSQTQPKGIHQSHASRMTLAVADNTHLLTEGWCVWVHCLQEIITHITIQYTATTLYNLPAVTVVGIAECVIVYRGRGFSPCRRDKDSHYYSTLPLNTQDNCSSSHPYLFIMQK